MTSYIYYFPLGLFTVSARIVIVTAPVNALLNYLLPVQDSMRGYEDALETLASNMSLLYGVCLLCPWGIHFQGEASTGSISALCVVSNLYYCLRFIFFLACLAIQAITATPKGVFACGQFARQRTR